MLVSLVDLLFPPRCFGCGTYLLRAERVLGACDACSHTVHRVESPRCPRCALPRDPPVGVDDLCAACLDRTPAFDRVDACFVYDGAVADAIRRSKAAGDPSSALDVARLATVWFDGVVADHADARWTTPPPHRRALAARGWDPALTLARTLGRSTPVRWSHPLVRTAHAVRKQALLGREERRRSLRDAFQARRAVDGHWVVFDDVLTTGATLDAVSRTLRRAGAESVSGVVLARSV